MKGRMTLSVHFFYPSLVTADFAAAAVLITYGAVLGKISRAQLLVVGMLEIVFFTINEWIVVKYLKISDTGGSMIWVGPRFRCVFRPGCSPRVLPKRCNK